MSVAKSRRPPAYALHALEIIARLGRRELSTWTFKTTAPWPVHLGTANRALSALQRRGWIIVQGDTIAVTDAGFAAATTGEGVPPPKPIERRAPKAKHARLPRGLF